MREILQVQIPRACGKDWGRMEKREEGRHCQFCQKTVVDFTAMSDDEIFKFFSGMRQGGVCGRFLETQIGRNLAPAPVQRNGWSGWKWVVASMLMLVRPPGGEKVGKAVVMERKAKRDLPQEEFVRVTSTDCFILATVIRKPRFVRRASWMPAVARVNPVDGLAAGIKMDSISHLNESALSAGNELVGLVGAVSFRVTVRPADTTILAKIAADTIASVAAFFKKEDFLTAYPNPVGRGEVLHLAWLADGGNYQLSFFNIRGQLVQERMVEVGGSGQVDQWEVPAGLAAGVYVMRIVKAGSSRVDSREILVR